VPESFLAVQWTRLPEGRADAAFCARIRDLLEGRGVPEVAPNSKPPKKLRGKGWKLAAAVAVVSVAVAAIFHFTPGTPQAGEARRLAFEADDFISKVDSGAEDYATADGLVKRAQELDPSVCWPPPKKNGADINPHGILNPAVIPRSARRTRRCRQSSTCLPTPRPPSL
jgi:hypothetical protein